MPNGTRWTLTEKMLHNSLKEITNQRDNSVHMPRLVKLPDKYIDGLTFGWMWYIFLMAISILFKDAIGLLVFISYVFFSWRHKKIKKEGTHVEW